MKAPRIELRRVLASCLVALASGCGGGVAVVGGDLGQPLVVTDAGDVSDIALGDRHDAIDAAIADDLPDAGPCAGPCPAGRVCCDGACVDPRDDEAHCGACGRRCTPAESCEDGRCAVKCSEGLRRCGEACVDLARDPSHCGACDNVCAEEPVCVEGRCAAGCPSGTLVCGGACVDALSDERNCGACGVRCGVDITCADGRCQTQCDPTTPTFCPDLGTCVDIRNDPGNCGRCGNACALGRRCDDGVCACPAAQLDCGGVCVPSTCSAGVGACARSGPQRCAGGAPVCAALPGAPSPFEVCNNIDDDCDGMVDEALTRPCYTSSGIPGVGVCRAGSQSCGAGSWGVCVGERGPSPEVCNGEDDDCNGQRDDIGATSCYTGATATRGRGRCRDGATRCVGGATRCVGEVLPLPELCNGEDDDCDGMTDEEPVTSMCPLRPNAVPSVCNNALCRYTCLAGFGDCDGDVSNGCEADLRSDRGRCGTCTNACPAGTVCSNGACDAVCTGTLCGAQCVDTATNTANCGGCGRSCAPPVGGVAQCVAGACVGVCPAGTTRCGNVCADLTRDPGHCGSCTVSCGPGQVCLNDTGVPTCECGTQSIRCNGQCVNPFTDPQNCGACGVRCGAGQSCDAGTCRCTATGTTLCAGACVTLGTNCSAGLGACRRAGTLVCGATGPICSASPGTPSTELCNNIDDDCDGVADNNNASQSCTALPGQLAQCIGGACRRDCFTDFGDCDGMIANGCETNLLDSAAHCGRCGALCPNGLCLAGACVPCAGSETACAGSCVDLATDPAHCGSCGRSCAGNERCAAGACVDDSVVRDGGGLD